jgi:hypothetical protein
LQIPKSKAAGKERGFMKKLGQAENPGLFLIIAVFISLALLPEAQAVVPAPDGGYPGANTAEGQNALFSLTNGTYNTAVGYFSLRSDNSGLFNTAVGAGSLFLNTGGGQFGEGDNNTATGAGALLSNTTGSSNTADGAFALANNGAGCGNTAVGIRALEHTTATDCGFNGSFNTGVGGAALGNCTLGNNNTALGSSAGSNVTTASNVICIGTDGDNVDNSCFIGRIFGATSSSGVAVYVNMNGRLGTVTSSRRFKDEIKPMDKASEVLLTLKPVTFHYKKEIDPHGIRQFGLVAEEVEKVNPDLVVRDEKGKPYSVRYDQVNAMLLNEFLKEHKKVEELKATVAKEERAIAQQREDFEAAVAEQKKEIQALTATAREQAEQIQKVSARFEVTESRSRTVLNNPQSDW